MSVRMGLLAVVAEGEQYAYEIRRRFEVRTGGAWPLNLGQVSSTLGRLERSGWITTVEGAPSDVLRREVRRYSITGAGATELAAWLDAGTDRATPARDELSMKVALALSDPTIDSEAFVQAQRHALLRSMQDLTRLLRHRNGETDRLWDLTLERMLLVTEAEIRWLSNVASRVATASRTSSHKRRATASVLGEATS